MKKALKTLLILFAAPLFGQNIYINEYLAGNDACCTDENGEYDDFIEITMVVQPVLILVECISLMTCLKQQSGRFQ